MGFGRGFLIGRRCQYLACSGSNGQKRWMSEETDWYGHLLSVIDP